MPDKTTQEITPTKSRTNKDIYLFLILVFLVINTVLLIFILKSTNTTVLKPDYLAPNSVHLSSAAQLDAKTKEKASKSPTEKTAEELNPSKSETEGTSISSNSEISHTYIKVRGILRLEKIPEDLMLGDTWYWLYFDQPFLLEYNATGTPLYIDKIQVFPPEDDFFYKIDDFVDKEVEIYGYLSWGYAESSVFQAVAFSQLY